MKQSDIAKVCIRIAWLYRLKKDEREQEFLEYALEAYTNTYNKESFPADKLDEYTCMYMIAELNRRAGKIEEAKKWFSKYISSPGSKNNVNLLNDARELYMSIKEKHEESNNV